jgi:lipopolysaccharide transport system permease protein
MSTVRALRSTWGVREYILASVKRDFASRYLGTQLGWFWAIAQPLAMIAIYTLVFASIMKPGLEGHTSPFAYSIYLCSGIIVWQLFTEIFTRSVGVFVNNANIIKKVKLPKFALPSIVALSSLINFSVIFALFMGFLVLIGQFPGWKVLAVLPLLLVVVGLALGLGIFLGTINVFYRDIEQTAGLLLGFWFWLTPIVYPARTVPNWLAGVLEWNPMWPIVRFAQTLFLDSELPSWSMLVYPTVVAMTFVLLGLHTFRKLGGELVDEL